MKKRVLFCVVFLTLLLLIGCSGGSEYKDLEKITPAESITTKKLSSSTALSKSDREQLIYQQIANRTLIDTTTLDKVNSEDKIVITNFMKSVFERIRGNKNDSIDDNFVNYILYEMQKTPYKFEEDTIEILGVNTSTRSYVVDVTFKTNKNKRKSIVKDSTIELGSDNYSKKTQIRLNRYLEILDLKSRGDSLWQQRMKEFENVYGNVDEIIGGQINKTLVEQAERNNFITYNNMVDSVEENTGATLKVRFILTYKYALGVNLGITCEHMYVTEYTLDKDILDNMEPYNTEGSPAIQEAVDTLIYSQNRAIDEDDYSGLNKLIKDFGKYDKHYYDMFSTTYRKTNGYAITIYDINDKSLLVGVKKVKKTRAKESNMSYPTYEEKWLYRIELIDNRLQITNEVLIKSMLIGEPSINTVSVGNESGFISAVNLKESDKSSIINTINEFSKLQLSYDTQSENFTKVVDMGIPHMDLENTRANMVSIENVISKATWIKSYNTSYSNYVNLTLLEVYYKGDNSALECESEISLISSNGSNWKVIEYNRLMSIDIDSEKVDTSSSISYVGDSKHNKTKAEDKSIVIDTEPIEDNNDVPIKEDKNNDRGEEDKIEGNITNESIDNEVNTTIENNENSNTDIDKQENSETSNESDTNVDKLPGLDELLGGN